MTIIDRFLVCILVPACIVFTPFVLGMVVQFLRSTWSLTNNFYLGAWEDCLDAWCVGFITLFFLSPALTYMFVG